MVTTYDLINQMSNDWRCPNCKGTGVEISEERTDLVRFAETRRARELRHYQRLMATYRRRLAYVTQLMREVMQAHARDAMQMVVMWDANKKLEARIAELESEHGAQ